MSISIKKALFNDISIKILNASVIFSVFGDVINALLQLTYESNTGLVQIVKAVSLLLNLINIKTKSSLNFLFIIVTAFFARELLVLLSNPQDFRIYNDVVFFTRILLTLSFLLVFYENRHVEQMTKFVTRLFIGVLILNSLISIYGYVSGISALAAYDGRDGTKGIFASVNDTAGLYSIAYLYGIANASTVLGFAFLIAVVIGSTLLALGSRSMFGILFLLPIAYFVFRNASQKKYVNAVGLILLGLAPVAVFFANFDYISNLFFSQSLRVFDETGSVFSALLSFRDLKIQSYFLSIGNPLDVIIGLQVSPRHLWNDLIPSSYMIESDLFDLLSRVGLIGTLAIVLLIKKVTSKGKGAAAQTMMFLVIVFGSLVGHFLVSSPNACWVSFWLVQFSTNRREKN